MTEPTDYKTVAFDIDGALNTENGMERYKELKKKDGIRVGIVTARTGLLAKEFVQYNELEPDFLKHTQFKGQALAGISDEGLYYGSWFRDRIHALIAGWDCKII